MKLNIPKNVKKIGLAMSGGCDSSLLLYLLCNQIVEDNFSKISNLVLLLNSLPKIKLFKFKKVISVHQIDTLIERCFDKRYR